MEKKTLQECKDEAQKEQTGKSFDSEWGGEFTRIVCVMERAAELFALSSREKPPTIDGEAIRFAEWLANEKYALVASGGNWYKQRNPEFLHTADMPKQFTIKELYELFKHQTT